MENVKMFLFCRWMAMCYEGRLIDNNMKKSTDKGFNPDTASPILNRETGFWYKEQLIHFNETVYPNYVKNGTVRNAELFLHDIKK